MTEGKEKSPFNRKNDFAVVREFVTMVVLCNSVGYLNLILLHYFGASEAEAEIGAGGLSKWTY